MRTVLLVYMEETCQQQAGVVLRVEEEKSPSAPEQKQGKGALTASSALRIQVAAGSPGVWLKITWLPWAARTALCAEHHSGHRFRDRSSLKGGADL